MEKMANRVVGDTDLVDLLAQAAYLPRKIDQDQDQDQDQGDGAKSPTPDEQTEVAKRKREGRSPWA
ncbi:hypothetical protein ACH492_34400 [Streptomyces sp. NPDC019443]|uniref:hypothetical protein n=1 Tax=Streptomyces sp. NPDC019443 TaxID=3365061 RepID=UPI0037A7A8EB